MKKILYLLPVACSLYAAEAKVIFHKDQSAFEKFGNRIVPIATKSKGAKEFEVWRSSWPPGGKIPSHQHETEETFVFLQGRGKVVIDGHESFFEAPCTVVCPANVPHQFFNTGDVPTDAIVILGVDSTIVDQNEIVMQLPWRR